MFGIILERCGDKYVTEEVLYEKALCEPVSAAWAKKASEEAGLREYQEAVDYINKKIKKATSRGEWEIVLIDFQDFEKPVDIKVMDIYKKMGFDITELFYNKYYNYMGEQVTQKRWIISWE